MKQGVRAPNNQTKLLWGMVCLFGLIPLWAQESESSSEDDREQAAVEARVIVRADATDLAQTPRAVTVIRSEPAERAESGRSLDALLSQVPGVEMNHRYSPSLGDRILIRGMGARAAFGTRGVKILLDGIPLTTADGTSQLNNVDPGMIGRIDVLRGPAASLHGNAAGGVIALTTARAPAVSRWGEITLRAGEWRRRAGHLRGGGREGNWQFQVAGSALREDGFRDHAAAAEERVFAHLRVDPRPAWQVSVVINHVHAPYLQAPGSVSAAVASNEPSASSRGAELFSTGKAVDQSLAGINLRRLGETGVWSLSLYGSTRELDNAIVTRYIDLSRETAGMRLQWHSINQASGRWKIGLDLDGQWDRRQEYRLGILPADERDARSPRQSLNNLPLGPSIQNQRETIRNIAPYVERQQNLGAWQLTGGLRYDRVAFSIDPQADIATSRTLSQISGFLGLGRPWLDGLAYINLASAFETPTANELGNVTANEPVPAIDPETTRGIEMGHRGRQGPWTWEGALFYQRTEDLIVPFTPTSGGATYFANAAAADNLGLEARIVRQWGNHTQIAFTYTGMDFRFDGDFLGPIDSELQRVDGNRVPAVVPQRFQWDIHTQLSTIWRVQARWSWRDQVWGNNANGPQHAEADQDLTIYRDPGYHRLDLRLAAQQALGVVKAHLQFGIDNLLDERYNSSVVPNAFDNRYFEPAPGRTYFANLTLRY